MVEGKEVSVTGGAAGTEAAEAARIAVRILQRGGNAMDAAAAACLASGVLVPFYCDVGGYVCSAVVLEGAAGKVWSLDSNSTAPAAAHPAMYKVLPKPPGKKGINENEYDCSVADDANVYGPLAAGVPGFMGGVGMLWERWGRLKWPQIVEPSLALLENGFPYDEVALEIVKRWEIIRRFEPSFRMLVPEGRKPEPRDIWHRPDLGGTLERLAKAGWRDFYEGEIGRRVGDYVSSIGGALRRDDMAAFQPRVSEPLRASFRGAAVYGPGLANGALSALQILNMLDLFEPLPMDDPHYWHRLAEILKLVWRDRLRYAADPGFVEDPSDRLLSRDYAWGRAEALRNFPDHTDRIGLPQTSANPHGTANVSVADREGNLVAVTLSQGNPFGSCVTVPGTGIILAHGMCRFDPRPGLLNSVAAGKRPLNNVCPIILRLPERDLAIGMRGGRRMISVVPQIAQRMVDYGMSPQAAVDSVRIHTLAYEPVECLETPPFPPLEAMRKLGHEIRLVDEVGGTAHTAEFIHATRQIRAGGSIIAAGF